MKFKKVLTLILAAAMIGLAACSGDKPAATQTQTPTQAATQTPTQAPTEAPAQTPTPATISGVDFSNGNYAFAKIDHSRKSSSPDLVLELASFDGAPALKIVPQGVKIPGIGFSLDTLLAAGDIPKVAKVAVKIGMKSLDGQFWPVTGKIYSYAGADLTESSSAVGIQTAESNPKIVYAAASGFVAGANNYVLFAPSQDDGTAYTGKNELYILGVGFMDADGNYLSVNADAGEAFPEGYDAVNDAPTYEYVLAAADAITPGGWNHFSSEKIPIEIWQGATKLVVEYAPDADGNSPMDTNADGYKFVVQVVGNAVYGDWGWNEYGPADETFVEKNPGKSVTLELNEFATVTQVGAVGIGLWDGGETVTRIYLVTTTDPANFE